MGENITIGITGGIGSGKSVIARILRCNGFIVYDCDSEARELMNSSLSLKNALKEKFGEDIYLPEGTLDRKKLASIIFYDAEEREYVNGIVHEAVRQDILKLRKEKPGYFFIEAAILGSGGLAPFCDSIWVVEAPLEERYERVKSRDTLSYEEIEKRIESQKKELTLLRNDNLIYIMNDGKHPVLPEVLKLTDKFINNYSYFISC